MKLPWVARSHHEEVAGDLRAQIVSLTRELFRLEDLIFMDKFGVQVHDTLPVTSTAEPEPEPELTPTEKAQEEFEDRKRRTIDRLTSIRRTSPSRLGAEMEKVMARNIVESARAARPSQAVFATARQDALKGNGNS